MRVDKIIYNKKYFLNLLLLADEQESMINRYLEWGDMFALYDGELKSVCVVARVDEDMCELKNLATYERFQRRGYGRALVRFVFEYYKNKYKTMMVGTGENLRILSFYEGCGFVRSHRVRNFFTENYDHPIFEDGLQLVDMVYLKKEL